jgi:L-alanine-DL-glutamate epimerase-like enolase superfamily enzyme
MKIIKLTTFIVPPRWCVLQIETDDGIIGCGEPVVEGGAHTVAVAMDEPSDYLIGKDPSLFSRWDFSYREGHLAIPQGPGLDEDVVRRAAEIGHCHADGSFAEW